MNDAAGVIAAIEKLAEVFKSSQQLAGPAFSRMQLYAHERETDSVKAMTYSKELGGLEMAFKPKYPLGLHSLLTLDATKKIYVKLDGAAATTAPEFYLSYVDVTDTSLAEASTGGAFNGSSDVLALDAPSTGKRLVDSLIVHNKDSATRSIIVEIDIAGTRRRLCEISLTTKQSLIISRDGMQIVPDAIADHGDLAGLSDDDHSQYVHISQARTITVKHTAPGFVVSDSAADPTAAGELQRNNGKLLFHDGTAARRLAQLTNSNLALGDTLYAAGANTFLSILTGNTTTRRKVLAQTGDGSASAAPSWVAPWDYVAKTANYTPVSADDGKLIACDASGGSFTVSLGAISGVPDGYLVGVMKTDSGTNTVTIDPNGAETVNAATTVVLRKRYECVWIMKTSGEWVIVGEASRLVPSFYAHKNGTHVTGLANGSDFKITFGDDSTAPGHDTHGLFDTTNSRLQPTEAGRWLLNVHVTARDLADTRFAIIKLKNQSGSAVRQSGWTPIGAAGDQTLMLTTTYDFNGSTDYVEPYFAHTDTDANAGYYGGSLDTWFTGFRISGR